MNIPRYWAKESQRILDPQGKPFLAQAWRWSNLSPGDARQQALQAVMEIVQRVRTNQQLDRYGYGERALREEIIEAIGAGSRQPEALITRNAYGALILNTARVMFVDIDFPEKSLTQGLGAALKSLLRRSQPSPEIPALQRLEAWTKSNPGWGMRVYRTKAGLRCLVTHDTFDPTQTTTVELLRSLQADPLYVTLCKNQACFRARLTPKPWRCGISAPPNAYPRQDENQQLKFQRWEQQYERKILAYATCAHITDIGGAMLHPEAEQILAIHDRYACARPGLPLA